MRTAFLASLVVLGLAVAGSSAHAETELVVLGPVGGNPAGVKGALGTVTGAAKTTKTITADCATDPGCLMNVGVELGTKRVLSVSVTGKKLTLTLVDVGARVLLGTRDIEVPKKVAKELPGVLTQFIEDATIDKAKALFAEGKQHYNLGEFQQALDKYKLAYRVKPYPAFQFNIAQCHRKLGQHKEAIAMYQAYLVDLPNAEDKPTVDSLIAEEQKALADQGAADDARERERLATERKKAEEARKIREAEAAAQAETQKTEQKRIEADRARDKEYNRHPARKFFLVTGALGLVTAGVGGYFAYSVRNRQTDYDDKCVAGLLPPDEVDACLADIDDGRRDARLANILMASGGGVMLVSILMLIIDPGNVERPAQQRVTITPTVTPTATSIQAVFKW